MPLQTAPRRLLLALTWGQNKLLLLLLSLLLSLRLPLSQGAWPRRQRGKLGPVALPPTQGRRCLLPAAAVLAVLLRHARLCAAAAQHTVANLQD